MALRSLALKCCLLDNFYNHYDHMDIFFLEASASLTKQYARSRGGELTKTPYPFTWEFTSHEQKFSSLQDLERLLTSHAALGHCVLKGKLNRPLAFESRAGTTTSEAPTSWLVLDLDGIDTTPDKFLQDVGLHHVSHIVQY